LRIEEFISVLGRGKLLFEVHDLFDLNQEPTINLGQVENLLDGEAGAQGVADEEDAFGVGHAQLAADDVARQDVAVAINFRDDAPGFAVAALAAAANLQRAQAFLQAFIISSLFLAPLAQSCSTSGRRTCPKSENANATTQNIHEPYAASTGFVVPAAFE
jgi:hypothetical protein